jgi:isopropylmalate/homocitrate/citramalate synthase
VTAPTPAAAPWFRPGRWLANPAYWHDDARQETAGAPGRIGFIDATLSEGDDCVGHQLNWNTRLRLAEALNEIGVDGITLPSHSTYEEERDWARAYRRRGLTTPIVAKGPGIAPPLRGDWRAALERHLELEADTVCPIFKWTFHDVLHDFSGQLSKQAVVDAIGESVAYLKAQGCRVVPWVIDSMRTRLDTVLQFYAAIIEAGGDGVYVVDSRGNSAPLATRVFIRNVRRVIGEGALYVQHHNDLGVATANAMIAADSGATMIDATVLGIGDRGGCVALEEIAPLLAMYGYDIDLDLSRLHALTALAQRLFRVPLAPWKPIAGEHWNKEEGAGHLDGAGDALASCGIAPDVVGRIFEGVIGGKLAFGRERSSVTADDHAFLRGLLEEWDVRPDEEEFARILDRTKAAVSTGAYISVEAFRAIVDGVMGG